MGRTGELQVGPDQPPAHPRMAAPAQPLWAQPTTPTPRDSWQLCRVEVPHWQAFGPWPPGQQAEGSPWSTTLGPQPPYTGGWARHG